MSKIYLEKRPLLIILAVSIMIAIYSMWQREMAIDDAWMAEQAYWLAQLGYTKSELLRGMSNFDLRHFTYHRLHIWQGALAYISFGWSAFTFKSISLMYLVIFIGVSLAYIKKFNILDDKKEYFIFYILILSYALIVKLSSTYRPDIPVMVLGFMSFYLLHTSIEEKKSSKALLSGILAGACVLAHLNGLVYIFAGGVALLITKNYRFLLYFAFSSAIISLLYFVEIRSKESLDLFLFQFTNSPALSDKDFSLTGSLMKFLSIYKTYFHKGSDAIYTILFIFIVWTQRHIIFNNERLRLIFIYFSAIAISLAIISPGGKTLYLIYHAPYAFLIIAAVYRNIFEQSLLRKRTLGVLFSLFLLLQWGETFSDFSKWGANQVKYHRDLAEELSIPKGTKIVAPMVFVFNEIENYSIQSFQVYRLRAGKGFIRLDDFFRLADEAGRKYLILEHADMKDLNIENIEMNKKIGKYTYSGTYGIYHTFKYTD